MDPRRLIRAGGEFDSSDLDALTFEEATPTPEPEVEPAEPWAMTKPMTPTLRERITAYLQHIRGREQQL